MRANVRTNGNSRRMLVGAAIIMAFLVFSSAPAYAKTNHGHSALNPHKQHNKYDPQIMQSAQGECIVSGASVTCQGGVNASSTFMNAVAAGDVVTVSMTYEDDNSSAPVLSVVDTVSVTPTVVVDSCAPTTPVICTEIAYFVVPVTSLVAVSFDVVSGTAGCIHYTAQDWFANNAVNLKALGTTGYCDGTCSGTTAMTPITFATLPNETIAVSQSLTFFGQNPTSVAPSLPLYYSYLLYGCGSIPAVLSLWQGTDGLSTSYNFNATATGAVPTVFAGAGAVLYV